MTATPPATGGSAVASNQVTGLLKHVYAAGCADCRISSGRAGRARRSWTTPCRAKRARVPGTNRRASGRADSTCNNTFGVGPKLAHNDDKPPPTASCASARKTKITRVISPTARRQTDEHREGHGGGDLRIPPSEKQQQPQAPESGGTEGHGRWDPGPRRLRRSRAGQQVRQQLNLRIPAHESRNPLRPLRTRWNFQGREQIADNG